MYNEGGTYQPPDKRCHYSKAPAHGVVGELVDDNVVGGLVMARRVEGGARGWRAVWVKLKLKYGATAFL